jgi:hypothetical protein
VYRYVLQDIQIDQDLRRLMETLSEPPQCILVAVPEYTLHCTGLPWVHWFADGPELMAHPYEADLEGHLAARQIPYRVAKPQGQGWAHRKHQFDAVERWYKHGWMRLDARLRSSITEG